MENYARWQLLMRDVTSPQSYIDFGFYFIIAAALQRRVWMGDDNPNQDGQLYPNIYPILVGDPGVGKGRVIIPVNNILRHWRQDISSGKILEPTEEIVENYENFLFPPGPDNITFEKLVDKLANAYRRTTWENCTNPLKTAGLPRPELQPKIYGHSSMYFALEELSSLMQKETNKITDFLIKVYDCGDYRRETKSAGIAQVKKPCLSLLAGTTPAFMEETFKDKLLTDGMSSRCWFIFEFANRKHLWGIKPLDNEQLKARLEILQWLHKLAFVYGRVSLSEEANAFLKHWWENEHPNSRPNNNLKLSSYYARKNIHVMKLCMILHFSETVDTYTIGIDTAIRALAELDKVERRMHFALNFGSRNPYHTIGKNLLTYMMQVRKPVTKAEILEEFSADLRQIELEEVLRTLQDTGKVIWKEGKYFPQALLNGLNGALQIDPKTLVRKDIPGGSLSALPLDKPLTNGHIIPMFNELVEGEPQDEPPI